MDSIEITNQIKQSFELIFMELGDRLLKSSPLISDLLQITLQDKCQFHTFYRKFRTVKNGVILSCKTKNNTVVVIDIHPSPYTNHIPPIRSEVTKYSNEVDAKLIVALYYWKHTSFK